MIKRLLNWLNPPHAWEYTREDVERRCVICGQVEQYGLGDEFGHTWDEVVPGIRARHSLARNEPVGTLSNDSVPAAAKLHT